MKKALIATLIASSAVMSTQAAQPSFDYVQLGMNQYDDADSLELEGSFKLNQNFFLTGNMETISIDQTSIDIDVLSFGIGYVFELSSDAAAYTKVEYIDFDANVAFEGDDSGYGLALGMKSMIAPKTELFAEIEHVNLEGSSTNLAFGLKQYFNDAVGGYVKYERNDFGDDLYGLGVSINF